MVGFGGLLWLTGCKVSCSGGAAQVHMCHCWVHAGHSQLLALWLVGLPLRVVHPWHLMGVLNLLPSALAWGGGEWS